MRPLREILSMQIPLLALIGGVVFALFANTYGRMIVGDEYHTFSMIVGFFLASGIALLCLRFARTFPPDCSAAQEPSERDQMDREAHRALMERHSADMEIKRLERKRLRQLIRDHRRGW